MAKKKDKSSKKLRTLEKQKKASLKADKTKKKKSKKQALEDGDDDDVDLDALLQSYADQQKTFETVTITTCHEPPSKRLNATLIASPVHNKRELLLFGGESVNENGLAVFHNELYSYSLDSDTWKRITSPNSPLPRSGHAMCVHPTGLVLLFGGEFSSPKQSTFYHYGDTWILDAQSKEWAKVDYTKGPLARSGHRLTYWKNYILLHGGFRDLSSSTTYLNDLWLFDVTTYKWKQVEFPPNHPVPDNRSGHSLIPSTDGAIVWGGYCKVKAGKGLQKGKIHSDCWALKMKADIHGIRWERRRKQGFVPSPRVGCSMVYHKGRGVLFGGVCDLDETEESLESEFYNNLFAYQVDTNRWFSLQLRMPKKKNTNVVSKRKQEDRDADLEEFLSKLMKNTNIEDNTEVEELEFQAKSEERNAEEKEDEKPKKEYPTRAQLPHPRFNSAVAVVDDVLFIYGGVWERGEREFNLDSFYSIDLGRLDGVKVYWEDLHELEEKDNLSEEEEEDDDDDDDQDEDDPEDQNGGVSLEDENTEVEEEEEEDNQEPTTEIPDPTPWLPQPKPFETLRTFYVRTGNNFTEWAISSNREARGKDLKKIAFELAEERWWERRESVRIAEDQLEEMGGVDEIIEKDPSQKTSKRR